MRAGFLSLFSASCILCVAACGATPKRQAAAPAPRVLAPAQVATTAKPAKVTVGLGFLITGWDAGFVAALDRGLYRRAGLDVSLQEARGTLQAMETVANGSVPLAQVDGGPLIIAVDRGLPVIGVAALFNASPSAVIVPDSSAIRTVKDLRGKRIGLNTSDSTGQLLSAVLAFNGMTLGNVRVVNMGSNEIVPALLGGKVDAVVGFSPTIAAALEGRGMAVRLLQYADNGVNQPGIALIANRAFARAHGALVRRFLQATRQGWAWARAHPAQAVGMEMRRFAHLNRNLELKELQLSVPLWTRPAAAAFDAHQYDRAQAQLLTYRLIRKTTPVGRIVTNAYVPK